jgi:hypothetical protein
MNPGEFTGAKEPSELAGVAPVGLDPVAGLRGNL